MSLALAGSLAACGSGGGGSADPKLAAACNDNLGVQDGFSQLFASIQGGPGNGPLSPADAAQVKENFPRLFAGPLDDIDKNAPAAIKSDLTAATAQLRNFGATADGSIFNNPDFKAQGLKIDNYFYDHCAGPKVAAVATEYKFTGLPDKVPAGVVQLKLTNSGKQEHEMLVLRRKPGVTESFDQILASGREEGQKKTEAVTQVSASPGKPDATVARLSPGQYIVICTVPEGTVGDKQGNGPPHFTMGMKKEFSVA